MHYTACPMGSARYGSTIAGPVGEPGVIAARTIASTAATTTTAAPIPTAGHSHFGRAAGVPLVSAVAGALVISSAGSSVAVAVAPFFDGAATVAFFGAASTNGATDPAG